MDGGFVESFIFWEGEGREDDGEEASERGEDANPVGEVDAQAGRILGVESCAGEGGY